MLGNDHGGSHGQSRGGQSFCRSKDLSTPILEVLSVYISHIHLDRVNVVKDSYRGVEHHTIFMHLDCFLTIYDEFELESETAETTIHLVEIVECPADGDAFVMPFELFNFCGNIVSQVSFLSYELDFETIWIHGGFITIN